MCLALFLNSTNTVDARSDVLAILLSVSVVGINVWFMVHVLMLWIRQSEWLQKVKLRSRGCFGLESSSSGPITWHYNPKGSGRSIGLDTSGTAEKAVELPSILTEDSISAIDIEPDFWIEKPRVGVGI